jgi:hypothetical protein
MVLPLQRSPTYEQVMTYLGLTRSQMRYRIRKGVLKARRHGRAYVFDAEAVAAVERYKQLRDLARNARKVLGVAPMDVAV